ncbi:tRNA (adenosine(37)-N6)-threonylcarbamoyltransferase complex dimerization subunit type 1 TsaB [Xylocopilactobacillus apis]|uniref:tRNA (Adenosine(37)-N6)-threonylcarbamoyltransferase complex dimerization subunit type 1 TsaB n=1 Tax=Xylocopilactobacillus apis TaxID=2932183 RepID=A0AAU9CRT7_9LACO|nr:tRNA (adenosine(37)-N6)-threonylcarbamoyltransferase complex dimerization subunit type 1 TsaB [Xylocopilactobacillus apis]BDR56654.1 tRNA (adenosine(37)-N6)-threonylcarbamoyltransferase complex dimerization subunit type 1 TsaB [Xylocopilactobacillus apis]
MLSLGIDCSDFGVSVALAYQDELIVENTTAANKRASKFLITQIQQLFNNTGRSLTEVEKIAVASGPGSFTGLKIGVTAGKVLAAVNNAQIYGISSLKNLAYPLLGTRVPVLALISARHNNFYAGIYQKQGDKIINLMPDVYANFSVIKENLSQFNDLIIIGSGLDEIKEDLEVAGRVVDVKENNLIPRGFSTIILSSGEEPVEAGLFVPNYIRDPQAVLVWDKNNPDHEKINYVEEI